MNTTELDLLRNYYGNDTEKMLKHILAKNKEILRLSQENERLTATCQNLHDTVGALRSDLEYYKQI